MKISRFGITICLFASSATSAFAWDGTNTNTGSSVEIEKGQLVRPGGSIEVYDSSDGEYKEYDVDSIYRSGGTVEIEATDTTTGESTTLEMDGN